MELRTPSQEQAVIAQSLNVIGCEDGRKLKGWGIRIVLRVAVGQGPERETQK
jgi:hypothetical protein